MINADFFFVFMVLKVGMIAFCLFWCFNVLVNKYGHVETVS